MRDDRIPGRMQTLRDIIDVKKWEINQAAGRYIRSHEAVQRISIRNRLNDFMQLSDMNIGFKEATPGESHPREALGECFL